MSKRTEIKKILIVGQGCEFDCSGAQTVKESVFPFVKFSGADFILSPEIKSTGNSASSGTRSLRRPIPQRRP